MEKINCFILYKEEEACKLTIQGLKQSSVVNKIYLLALEPAAEIPSGCELILIASFSATSTIRTIANYADTPYILLYNRYATLYIGLFALERMLQIAGDTRAGMLYADRYQLTGEGERKECPVIDYQLGSLRDDFDFGSLFLYKTSAFQDAVKTMDEDFRYAGWYDLRLKISQREELVHINEFLYTEKEYDTRTSGEKMFDYVDPKNRTVQEEMEKACTNHLKQIGGYLPPVFKEIDFNKEVFEYEASVIIPVRNRARTIGDAIRSVLKQETSFPFNLIIINNHSTDGTTEIINRYASDTRIIQLIPERYDLGIGGCWNMGVHHPLCGKFAVQLDSDDVYGDEHTLEKIVTAFYRQKCAMVVGTYRMTDFDMNTLPPGIIDHREWTLENGRNNALRINGFGAPRAFYTPLLREIKLPNTSYGEDYAVALAISRYYRIGRIYEVLYLCRRWEDNTDASLDTAKVNANHIYKDRIRTWELKARMALNLKK